MYRHSLQELNEDPRLGGTHLFPRLHNQLPVLLPEERFVEGGSRGPGAGFAISLESEDGIEVIVPVILEGSDALQNSHFLDLDAWLESGNHIGIRAHQDNGINDFTATVTASSSSAGVPPTDHLLGLLTHAVALAYEAGVMVALVFNGYRMILVTWDYSTGGMVLSSSVHVAPSNVAPKPEGEEEVPCFTQCLLSLTKVNLDFLADDSAGRRGDSEEVTA